MASTIKLKNGSGAPLAGDLVQGEPALDLTNKRLYTEDSGGTVIEVGVNPAAEITANGGIALPDSQKATFGASDDLQIYHDGSNSYIDDTGTGDLTIRGNNITLGKYANEIGIKLIANGAAEIYHDNNNLKLATTATGIDVTGTVVSDGLTVDGTATIQSAFPVLNFTDSDGNPDYQIQGGNGRFSVLDSTASATRFRIDNGGDISFYEDTGTTAKFFWDASAESLGIGTTSPSGLLHLSSSSPKLIISDTAGTGSTHIIDTIGTNGQNFVLDVDTTANGGNFIVEVGGSERMRIDSSGNVGIGTSSPAQLLELSDGAPRLRLTDSNSVASLASCFIEFHGSDARQAVIYTSDGDLITQTDNQGGGDFVVKTNGNNERMRIDTSGNVGIGDSAPTERLVVSRLGNNWEGVAPQATTTAFFHSGTTNDNSGSALTIAGGDTGTNSIYFSSESDNDVGAIFYSNTDNSMQFRANGNERMRIDSSGNVGIGITSPSYLVDAQSSGDAAIRIRSTGTGASDDSLLRLQIGGTTASNIIAFGDSDTSFAGEIRYTHSNNNMSFDTNGSERMRIDSSGNVGIGTSSPAAKLEIGGAGEGIILASPDGTRYEITVANGGTLTVTAV